MIALLLLIVIFAPCIAPHSPTDQSFIDKLQGPSREHLMGTDEFGRDTLSRVIYGSRVALRVGLLPVAVALIFGGRRDSLAGYYGGVTDQITMRMVDILLAFPWLLLAIGIVAILGPGINNVIIAVTIIYIPAFARIVRSSVFDQRARVCGGRPRNRSTRPADYDRAISSGIPGLRSSFWRRFRLARRLFMRPV